MAKTLPSNTVLGGSSIPGWGAKIPHIAWPKIKTLKKKKKKQYYNKFNKDFLKNGPHKKINKFEKEIN